MQHVVRVFSLCGPPGAGKGTLAVRCQKELQAAFLSVGDLCRKYIAQENELGRLFSYYINQGMLVPDELIITMVNEWMVEALHSSAYIMLDGYPRTVAQAEALIHFLKKNTNVLFEVLFFDVIDDVVVDRISARLVCSNAACQAIYSLLIKPPQTLGYCDVCSAPLMRRRDDDPSVVRTRLQSYNCIRNALVDCYQKQQVTLKVLDATYLTQQQVFNWFIDHCVPAQERKEIAL
jgi:adenylate kinase